MGGRVKKKGSWIPGSQHFACLDDNDDDDDDDFDDDDGDDEDHNQENDKDNEKYDDDYDDVTPQANLSGGAARLAGAPAWLPQSTPGLSSVLCHVSCSFLVFL